MNDKKINVLLVDDEEALLNSMRRRLEFRDFNVIAANRGEKALELAREHPLDVAIVDVKMPGMSGNEVIMALKKAYPWMEIIVLTGHGTFNPEEEGIAGKLHTCLAKPCDFKVLQDTLVEAFKKTVMNRRQIEPRRMDEMLKNVYSESSAAVLKTLKDINNSQQSNPEEV